MITIGFCQRLEIGLVPQALQFQRDMKLDCNTLKDIFFHKQFKYKVLKNTII